jgi:dipicolinate synthase subunit B
MKLEQVRLGIGLTGSFCTFEAVFAALETMRQDFLRYTFVLSAHVQQLDNRFYPPQKTLAAVQKLTTAPIITSISGAEPLGPGNLLDVFLIAPCTGNTLAKLALGVTDTPVLMAAKGHLRGEKPLVLALATNDALGANLRNIATLMNSKNIYLVPLAQDAPEKKPHSLVADMTKIRPAILAALRGKQLQPFLL